jgi:hypothetical protein
MQLGPIAQLTLDTINQKPVRGIPAWLINPMEHSIIDRLAGVEPGTYVQKPSETYLAMQKAVGTGLMDQWLAENPLSMGARGYEGASHGATTGAHEIVVDGMVIDSPETAVDHVEKFVFPQLKAAVASVEEDAHVRRMIEGERAMQEMLGPNMLKVPYGGIGFPGFAYGTYGYVNYFSACALYPEVLEKWFSLQADVCILHNRATARAYQEGSLPPLNRLDHDMADSRGTLVRPDWLDKYWFPHFARSLEPMLKTNVKMIWHCDGNLMEMVPRLLDCGVVGFQGFQYEDGMDYEKICKMKTRDGEDLVIVGGSSVTRTLPFGTPDDVVREMKWLVEKGPKTGLFLGGSSSIAPGVPWENMKALVEGFAYYRKHGRA